MSDIFLNGSETPTGLKGFSTSSFTPLFEALLNSRCLTTEEERRAFLYPSTDAFLDPFLMKGMREAKSRIEAAIQKKEKLFLHGDYDVDGITGTAILARALKQKGASFSTFLPERKRDGYGVSERAIRQAKEDGAVLFITIDCGITAKKQIKLAASLGLETIVIDHHRIPEDGVPEAKVILNPLQEDCPYPFKELSAGGLAFKLSQALIGDDAFTLLDFAALSAISDVVPLVSENRIIVKKGLEVLSSQSNKGIEALSKVSKLKSSKVTTTHLSVCPRIRAFRALRDGE